MNPDSSARTRYRGWIRLALAFVLGIATAWVASLPLPPSAGYTVHQAFADWPVPEGGVWTLFDVHRIDHLNATDYRFNAWSIWDVISDDEELNRRAKGTSSPVSPLNTLEIVERLPHLAYGQSEWSETNDGQSSPTALVWVRRSGLPLACRSDWWAGTGARGGLTLQGRQSNVLWLGLAFDSLFIGACWLGVFRLMGRWWARFRHHGPQTTPRPSP